MLRKTLVALAAVLALGSATVSTTAFARGGGGGGGGGGHGGGGGGFGGHSGGFGGGHFGGGHFGSGEGRRSFGFRDRNRQDWVWPDCPPYYYTYANGYQCY
jgi:hypothetical protein